MLRLLQFCFLLLAPGTLLAQTAQVFGMITDGQSPLPGVTVRLQPIGLATGTDIDGNFNFSRVPPGAYTLLLNYVGMQGDTIPVSLEAAQSLDLGRIIMQASNLLQEVEVRADISGRDVKAINLTRLSARPVSVLAAEGVGKLPDRNAAEAVQRLAGVVMERDHGEGRWISFRGTPADWSAALVNGDRMPVADEESKSRALNFDIFPASLIEYVVVSRALTPDLEGDAIGGSANFMTRSAPQKKVFNASVSGGWNAKAQSPAYNASLLLGNRSKNERFAWLIGGSYYQRDWATDNYQIFYGANYDHSINRAELRVYNGQRRTLGGNAALEYRFNSKHLIFAKGIYGSMDDDEYNRKMMFAYNPGIGQSIKLQNIHNILSTRFAGGEIGGRSRLGTRLNAEWKVATYHNRFQYGAVPFSDKKDHRNGYYVIEFEKQVYYTDFLYLDEFGNQTDEANAAYRYKFLDIDSPVPGYGDPHTKLNPTYNNIIPVTPTDTLYQFVKAYTETNRTREQDPVVAQLDFNWQSSENLRWKAGAKYRLKTGSREVGLELWDRNPAFPKAIVYDSFALQPVDRRFLPETGEPYQNTLANFLSDEAIKSFLTDNERRLRFESFGVNTPYYNQFIGSSYRYQESVAAAYLLAELDVATKWHLNAGFRAEYTLPTVRADSVIEDIANSTRYLVERAAGKNYLALLPMFNLRFAPNDKQAWRFAFTRSFRRPNFNEIKPGQASIDYTNFELIVGNPALKPSYALNFDLVYERYLDNTGLFSVSAYYKYVNDHIYTAFESSSADNAGVSNEFQVPGGVIAKKYQNAPTAFAAGLELSYFSKLNFLRGWWRHFGVNANLTLTASEMRIPSRTAPQPLPRQSKYLANAAIFYENDKINARLALNYKAPYLMELNLFAVKDPNTGQTIVVHQDNDFDMYIGANLSLDAALSYKFTKTISFFAEANNLSNMPFVIYRGRRDRPVKTEYYGIRGLAGFRHSL